MSYELSHNKVVQQKITHPMALYTLEQIQNFHQHVQLYSVTALGTYVSKPNCPVSACLPTC